MSIKNTKQGLYTHPSLYDILYTPGTAAEITAMKKVAGNFISPLQEDALWLEPACGTGRYLAILQRHGARVIGFDIDAQQVAYCRDRLNRHAKPGKAPEIFVADMAKFNALAKKQGLAEGMADLAFNPVNSIRHLGSDKEMLAHFADVATFLRPGGIYIIGISLTDYDWLMHEEDLWEGARGRCKVSQLVNYLPPEPGTSKARMETVISHLTVTRPRGSEHFDDTYDLRTYDQKQWFNLIKKSALVHAGSFDAAGTDLQERMLPYQLEVLQKK